MTSSCGLQSFTHSSAPTSTRQCNFARGPLGATHSVLLPPPVTAWASGLPPDGGNSSGPAAPRRAGAGNDDAAEEEDEDEEDEDEEDEDEEDEVEHLEAVRNAAHAPLCALPASSRAFSKTALARADFRKSLSGSRASSCHCFRLEAKSGKRAMRRFFSKVHMARAAASM